MKATLQPAQIKLQSLQVLECVFRSSDSFNPAATTGENILNLDHRTILVKENQRIFIVEFKAHIENAQKSLNIDIVFQALFESSIDIDDKFLQSNFVLLNAPSIAFPFLRSFITTLTANAGFNPLILPAINFAHTMQSAQAHPKK